MSNENSSIVSHLSIGTNQFEAAREFYNNVLSCLGVKVLMECPGAICYGKQFPEFWVQTPLDGSPASVGNGFHIGFFASSKQQVHAFYDAAIAAGAMCDGPPGPQCIVTPTTVALYAIWMATK